MPLVHDKRRLDVVLVLDLADDLFDQVLERHEARRPAVFVDDDGALRLLILKLLQELGHQLRLRNNDGRADQRLDGTAVVARAKRDEVFDEDEARDVIEALLEHREPRILLLPKQSPQLADAGALRDGDDVGPRRHDLAHQRGAEVDDALQQPPLFFADLLCRLGAIRRRR